MGGARRRLLAGLLMLVTAVAFEAQSVSTAMPAVAADLGQLDLYAWAFTAFVIPQVVAIVLGGRLCDSRGPGRPLQWGIAVFAVGLAISASSLSMPMFLAGRFVQGFGGGLVNVAVMVVVGRGFRPQDTGRVMTWFSFAWMLPSFLGPSAAAWITRVTSWHVVFWGVLPLVGAGAALLLPALARARLEGVHDPDGAAPASLWLAIGAALGAGLMQGAGVQIGWWTPVLVAAAVGLLVPTVPRLMPSGWSLLGGGLSATIATRALFTGAFFAAASFLPLMLTKLRGQDLEVGGYALTVASLGWTGGSWLQSRSWLPLSRDGIVTLGVACVLIGQVILAAFTVLFAWPLWIMIAGATLAGVGMGLASASTSLVVMQLSGEHELGRNTGALQVGEALGNALIVGLAGTFFGAMVSVGRDVESFAAVMGLSVLCALLALVFSRRVGLVPNLSARVVARS